METNYIENVKEVKVSENTKKLIGYLVQVEDMHESIIEMESQFQKETDGLELTGISIHEAGFFAFRNLLKELIAHSVMAQIEWTKAREV